MELYFIFFYHFNTHIHFGKKKKEKKDKQSIIFFQESAVKQYCYCYYIPITQ